MVKKIKDENGNVYKLKKPFYKKIWFWILVAFISFIALGTGEDSKNNETPTSKNNVEKTDRKKLSAEEQYQTILDTYTKKLQEESPKLVEEYNNEYPDNNDGLEGLAKLSNKKIEKLAKTSNDGISEMAKVMMKSGTGNQDEYMDWSQKLMDVYMEEAQKITDAYTNSAM